MLRKVGAVVAGLIAGMVVVTVGLWISTALYPLPEGLDPNDPNDATALRAHIERLPLAAMLLVLASDSGGALAAGAVSSLVAGRRWYAGAAVLGLLFLLAGIANLMSIPHPVWFAVMDVLLYLPMALAGSWMAGKTMGAVPAMAGDAA